MKKEQKGNRSNKHEEAPDDEDFSFEDDPAEENARGAEETVARLRKALKQCRAEKQDNLDGWQRAQADLLNRRRGEQERIDTERERAREKIIREILPVLDSFDMAFNDAEQWEAVNKEWRDGITRIYNQLLGVLNTHGVVPIEARGHPFDPEYHESIKTEVVDSADMDNIVIEEMQKGYAMNKKVIRPARVSVGHYEKR